MGPTSRTHPHTTHQSFTSLPFTQLGIHLYWTRSTNGLCVCVCVCAYLSACRPEFSWFPERPTALIKSRWNVPGGGESEREVALYFFFFYYLRWPRSPPPSGWAITRPSFEALCSPERVNKRNIFKPTTKIRNLPDGNLQRFQPTRHRQISKF